MARVAGAPRPPLRVALISKVSLNPYVSLLAQGLEKLGVQCSSEGNFGLPLSGKRPGRANPDLLHRDRTDILHFHWLELLYLHPSWRNRLRRTLSVLGGMWLAGRHGIRTVYTVHNLMGHEERFARWNEWVNRRVFRVADAIHVHDEQMREEIERRYGRTRDVYTIPHGNYIGAYPDTCSREEARERLGLDPRGLVFLFMGQLRPYKGVEDLIQAFKSVARTDEILFVAGRAYDPGYRTVIQRMARGCAGIKLRLAYVPPEEVQYLMRSADVCVLPYRHVSTSGAAMLAFSFGTPIIAPALGGFVETAEAGRGLLYDPLEEGGLTQVLTQARFVDWSEAGEAAMAYAETLDWDWIAEQHLGVYGG